jgi:Tfp pilus assembly protein PilF
MGYFSSSVFLLVFGCCVSAAQDLQQLTDRADLFLVRRDYQRAATEYVNALRLSPKNAMLHNKLGMCHQWLGDLSAAEREYEQARRLDSKNPNVWNNLGTVQYSRGRYKQAVKSYKKAVQLKPDMSRTFHNLGAAYLAWRKPTQAMEAFQEAVRIDPAVMERTLSEAISVQAVGVDSGFQNFCFAKICAQNGQLENALIFLERALKNGFKDLAKIVKDPAFAQLTQEPRFIALTHPAEAPPK